MIYFIIGFYLLNFLFFAVLLALKIKERLNEKKDEQETLDKYKKY